MNGWEHYKVGATPTSQGQSGASDSQPASSFRYLKNLLLTIQTLVLRCVELDVSLITNADIDNVYAMQCIKRLYESL